MKCKNIKFIEEIREETYGKLLTFEDPDGHWLEFYHNNRPNIGKRQKTVYEFIKSISEHSIDRIYNRLPAVWKAIVSNNKFEQWQVYSDSKIPLDIIKKNEQEHMNASR